jgi:hypothetical protein
MTRRIIVSPEALAQVDAIDDWWRKIRPAARDLFASELRVLAAWGCLRGRGPDLTQL